MEKTEERLDRLEGYVPILRGLINYHKRMMLMGPCYVPDPVTKEFEVCPRALQNKGACPKTTAMNDVYLGALEESLRLIEKEITTLKVC